VVDPAEGKCFVVAMTKLPQGNIIGKLNPDHRKPTAGGANKLCFKSLIAHQNTLIPCIHSPQLIGESMGCFIEYERTAA